MSEGNYDLYIKAYNKDNESNCEQRIIPFKIKQSTHSVVLTDLSIPTYMVCGKSLVISGKLANIGKEGEDNVKIVYSDGLNKEIAYEIEDLDSGDISESFDFLVNMPKNDSRDNHAFTLTVYYDYDDKTYDESEEYSYSAIINGECNVQRSITPLSTTTIASQEEGISFSDLITENWKTMAISLEVIAIITTLILVLIKAI